MKTLSVRVQLVKCKPMSNFAEGNLIQGISFTSMGQSKGPNSSEVIRVIAGAGNSKKTQSIMSPRPRDFS